MYANIFVVRFVSLPMKTISNEHAACDQYILCLDLVFLDLSFEIRILNSFEMFHFLRLYVRNCGF